MKNNKTVEQLAKEHSRWFSRAISTVYNDAFIHGYKHGKNKKN